jgi:aspartate 1-decarboxylase
MRVMLKSKIHRATVTDANIDYEGSITIDKKLMEAADILPYEQVHVLNISNGHRFTTYTIEGEKGEICLNGAAALLAKKGDLVIILTYATVSEEEVLSLKPKVVLVDADNKIRSTKSEIRSGSAVPAKVADPAFIGTGIQK